MVTQFLRFGVVVTTLAVVAWLGALTMPVMASPPDASPVGTWKCSGTQPDGETYYVKPAVSVLGQSYSLIWSVPGGVVNCGLGVLHGDRLSAGYVSQHGPGLVIYTVTPGHLDGVWMASGWLATVPSTRSNAAWGTCMIGPLSVYRWNEYVEQGTYLRVFYRGEDVTTRCMFADDTPRHESAVLLKLNEQGRPYVDMGTHEVAEGTVHGDIEIRAEVKP